MTSTKCVVEGCNSEYDVNCTFSFFHLNTVSDNDQVRQEWIDSALQEDECVWKHVTLQLCGYHFEVDAQGLWVDSPMLPDLLAVQEEVVHNDKVDIIRSEHNYSSAPELKKTPGVSRLNVRQLVDTLGYLTLKKLQRKQLWVVRVDSDTNEANIMHTEQVITKMPNASKIIELIPPSASGSAGGSSQDFQLEGGEGIDNFIYEIAQEQEIAVDDSKQAVQKDWAVNILPDESRPKYAFINCNTGKKKRHFTSDVQIEYPTGFENYYILPDDIDTTMSVEVTTSDNEPENTYIVNEYDLSLFDRPKKRPKEQKEEKRKKRPAKERTVSNTEIGEDWIIQNNISMEDEDTKVNNPRVRRKNKKYLGYDFVT